MSELPFFTRQHWGLIVVVVGTVLLAFSVQVVDQYDKERLRSLPAESLRDKVIPNQTYINLRWYYFGLVLIALGSASQW